ncbi:MAG: hypothetical protein HG458_008420 [Prevotella sp.]|nr:hypothetical protein [Prevotella sp.]
MRKLLLLSLFLVMAIVSRAQGNNFFAVHEGIYFRCEIVDAVNKKISIAPDQLHYASTYPGIRNLIIPEKLTAPSGIEYTVTAIGDSRCIFERVVDLEEVTFPKTIEHMGWVCAYRFQDTNKLRKITIQALKSHNGVIFGGQGNTPLEIRLPMTTLPENTMSGVPLPAYQLNDMNLDSVHVFVPVDYSYLYKSSPWWSIDSKAYVSVPYYEELKIGPNGYTSYYLENENFEVPTGSTAYIIKGAINRLNYTGDAVVEAFPAGSIIPKQTGFILSGTAGSTVAYRACVDGPEVDVIGNLLVGTATEQEFSGAGYKYYIFGNGSEGQGFYHQGTRKGNSMKVGAHRAGLKLPTTGFSPAKPFVFNFEEAVRNTVTGISTVKTESAAKDAPIYNLQGCRVTNPTNGIYIVNGKKVLIKK